MGPKHYSYVARKMDIAYALARANLSSSWDSFSTRTREATLQTLLDSLACAIAGSRAPGMAQVRAALAHHGTTGCQLWGGFGQAPAPLAAFINACALSALDFEDTDDAVPLHVCSVVVPALLADLEQSSPHTPGRTFLAALAVGIDSTMRIGRAGVPKGTKGWNWGMQSSSMGAILAIAHLRRWSPDKAVHALGHLLTHMGGSLQAVIEGCAGMRLQPGFMAQSAMLSTALAEVDIKGPQQLFGGRAGLISLFQNGQLDERSILEGPDQCALVNELSLKLYPTCRFTHPSLDLGLRFLQQGVAVEHIRSVKVTVTKQTRNMVGKPYAGPRSTILDAQFSIPYTLSTMLHRGQVTLGDFSQTAIHDERICAFAAEKITVEADPSSSGSGLLPASLNVQLTNGTSIELRADSVSGSPGARVSAAQLHAKVADCLAYAKSAIRPNALIQAVQSLERDASAISVLELIKA